MLNQAYPLLKMDIICKVCLGKPNPYCKVCRRNRKFYQDYAVEVQEMNYLYTTWCKCKLFKQVTTGIRKLDALITLLFGKPHDENWRDYSKVQPRINTTAMRMVGDA